MTYPQITPDQVKFYEEEGYLIVKSNKSLYDISNLQSWTQEVLSWPLEVGKWMPYYEINTQGEKQLMRTEKIVDYHDGFRDLLGGDAVLGLLRALTGKEVCLFKDKINYKLPGANGFQAHLDAPAYTHIGNFPKSHKMDIPLVGGGSIDPEWEAKHEFIKVSLEAGDILIFGSSMAHRSGPNLTNSQRAGFFATYNFQEDGTDLREKY
ncbi:hypothetical protein H072_10457 [Dactylellina haptotyla CBS 200.50]|uniref:Fe2OG dioxygenase domain-containing protein n=1 Tax=Dactylellina haptotyla (strain CBS 200.50) TaxID=1284197 RepID=S8BA80_DACHA|nr:hypothetical protein H072_10457 [Dactylellina haptotyla CBS 200.50]